MSPLDAAVAAPLAGAVVALLLRGRAVPAAGAAAGLATTAAAAAIAVRVWEDGAVRHPLGGWSAPLGIELHADGMSALLVVMTAAVGLAVTAYSLAEPARAAFWPLWLFLWAALNGLFLARDVFNVYVALELATLSAIALVLLAGTPVARRAAMRYMLAALAASLSYLLGVALLYGAAGTLAFDGLADRLEPGLPAWTGVGLATAGLAVKAALFPLHFWLPPAHANAPAGVSAVLSALVVKAAVFVLLRLWLEAFPEIAGPPAAGLVGALGAAAIVWGSAQAIRQSRLKLLIAYSTVAQLGYVFLVFPLLLSAGPAEPWREEALAGGVYQALSHGLAKAAMFLAAGNVLRALGTDEIRSLAGMAQRLPLTTYVFGIAGITMMGVPPSGGFVAKWLLLKAAVGSGQWWIVVPLVAGGFLAAAYVFVVFRYAFMPVPAGAEQVRLPRTLDLAPAVLALASLLLGVRAKEPLELLGRGTAALLGAGG
jgi:multicomponent Na+:H+ antiporter subunit D